MMAYFSVYAMDAPGKQDLRQRLRPAHRERLRAHDHPVTVHIGGPLLGGDNEMIGTLLVVEAADGDAVEAFLSGDPYMEQGLFRSVEIRPFLWGLGQPDAARDG
ncbi:YciI family protein [Rhodobacterales bacterium HKCCE2091]|nr:YciI family protein [Rhodobacterales bacterium HKCCE2091]